MDIMLQWYVLCRSIGYLLHCTMESTVFTTHQCLAKDLYTAVLQSQVQFKSGAVHSRPRYTFGSCKRKRHLRVLMEQMFGHLFLNGRYEPFKLLAPCNVHQHNYYLFWTVDTNRSRCSHENGLISKWIIISVVTAIWEFSVYLDTCVCAGQLCNKANSCSALLDLSNNRLLWVICTWF